MGGLEKELHLEQFGVSQIRVLTITDSAKRVGNMLSAVDEITAGKGSNFFLFGHRQQLSDVSPLDVSRKSGKGEQVKLVE